MTVGHPDWQGIAPLSQALLSAQMVNALIGPQGVFSARGPITRQGYEISVQLAAQTTGSVAIPVLIEMVWQEQQTNTVTGYQRWWVFSGDQLGAQNIVGQGPSNGNQLTVIVTNFLATTPSIFANITVLDVARPYQRHDWRTRDQLGPVYPGSSPVPSDIASGVYASVNNVTIPANGQTVQTCPLYAGKLQFKAFNTGTAAMGILLNNAAIEPAGLSNQPFELVTVGSQTIVAQGSMNANQGTLQVENLSSTVPLTAFILITTLDY